MKLIFENWRNYLNENISQMLQSLRDADQDLRNKWAATMKEKGGFSKELAAEFAQEHGTTTDDLFNDAARQREYESLFKELTDEHFEKFEDKDFQNLWLLAQHADHNRELQRKVRDILKKYNRQEEYEYIADRITCGESGTQKFGTQDICEKEEEASKEKSMRIKVK